MRYSHAALNPVSIGERKNFRASAVPMRRTSMPGRIAWKIVYSGFVAGVAVYVWWRR